MSDRPDFVKDFLLPTQRLMQGDPIGRAFQDLYNRRWLLGNMPMETPFVAPGPTPGGYSILGVDGDQVWNALAIPDEYFPAYLLETRTDDGEGNVTTTKFLIVADWELKPGDLYTDDGSGGNDGPAKYMLGRREAIVTPKAPYEDIHEGTGNQDRTSTPSNPDNIVGYESEETHGAPGEIPVWSHSVVTETFHSESSLVETESDSSASEDGIDFIPKGGTEDGVHIIASLQGAYSSNSHSSSRQYEDYFFHDDLWSIGLVGEGSSTGSSSTTTGSNGESESLRTRSSYYTVNGVRWDDVSSTSSESSSGSSTSTSGSTWPPMVYYGPTEDSQNTYLETITGEDQSILFFAHKWCKVTDVEKAQENAKTILLAARFITHNAYTQTMAGITDNSSYECECIIFNWKDGSKTASKTHPDGKIDGMDISGMCLVYLK